MLKDEFMVIHSNNQKPDIFLKDYFKGIQSQGFKLENTHMTSLEQLMKLKWVVAVVILAVWG